MAPQRLPPPGIGPLSAARSLTMPFWLYCSMGWRQRAVHPHSKALRPSCGQRWWSVAGSRRGRLQASSLQAHHSACTTRQEALPPCPQALPRPSANTHTHTHTPPPRCAAQSPGCAAPRVWGPSAASRGCSSCGAGQKWAMQHWGVRRGRHALPAAHSPARPHALRARTPSAATVCSAPHAPPQKHIRNGGIGGNGAAAT